MAFTPQTNVSLKEMTTLRVGGEATLFGAIRDERELPLAFAFARIQGKQVLTLGGGSNTLVPDAGVDALVLKVAIEGVTFEEVGDTVLVTAGAGTSFDALVGETVARGLWGLENLSAIPGTVGATPVQNVGAYGVEVSELIKSVRVYDSETDTILTFTKEQCEFAYRDSHFKREAGRFVVVSVTYELSIEPKPKLTYKDLALWAADRTGLKLEEIRDAVIAIRSKKFPDITVIGTAGSFFKNPIVSAEEGERLKREYPELPLFAAGPNNTKVALGWVLEHVLAIKGIRKGNVGTFAGQALVLVAYDGATASEIDTFASKITQDVFDHTGVTIEREVVTMGA